jgi:hypothetical protein
VRLRNGLKVAHQRNVPVIRQLYVAGTNHLPHDGTRHICRDAGLATHVLYKLVRPVRRVGQLKGLPYPAFRRLVLSVSPYPTPLYRYFHPYYTLGALYSATFLLRVCFCQHSRLGRFAYSQCMYPIHQLIHQPNLKPTANDQQPHTRDECIRFIYADAFHQSQAPTNPHEQVLPALAARRSGVRSPSAPPTLPQQCRPCMPS